MGLGAAVGFTATRTPIYESSSTIFVSTQAGSSAAELQQGSSFAQARINTYVGLVTTPIVLEPVISQLGLPTTPESLAKEVKASGTLNSTLIAIAVSDPDAARAATLANAVAASLSAVVPQLEPEASDGTSPVRLSLVSEAQAPASPSSPNIPLNLALGALIGLAWGSPPPSCERAWITEYACRGKPSRLPPHPASARSRTTQRRKNGRLSFTPTR